jgi:hypothetical protein
MMLSSTMTEEKRQEKGYYAVGGCGGNIAWHTENDTLEIADRGIMLRDIKVYLALTMRIANAEVLPFDWRAIAAEFLETIARYQQGAGNHFDLGPSKAAAEQLRAALDRFYAAVGAKRVPAGRASDTIQALARVLVPINHTRVPRFRHDPATPIPPLPTIALAGELTAMQGDRISFAVNTLRRGQNRVVAALRDATRRVEAALA